MPTCIRCLCQDALEALGEEDAACLQGQLKGGAPAKLAAAEGRVFEVTPAMVDISRVQKKVAGRCVHGALAVQGLADLLMSWCDIGWPLSGCMGPLLCRVSLTIGWPLSGCSPFL